MSFNDFGKNFDKSCSRWLMSYGKGKSEGEKIRRWEVRRVKDEG